ncbi:hypothetical protein EHS25_006184 [Saitozyma podzolica]|uniref:Uncharacterized protein n=1 Tax=Saitozyma podzolica TaxID=1890683 RepID=A0A427XRM6_9TREE|nr:hypothetical protein EHS25_006184 [Saitozyma podzolica]
MAPTTDAAGPSSGPHRMRITTGGSVQAYDHPNRPLVLHTLPPSTQSATSASTAQPRSTLLPCALATPKLVSVAEVIKRAYIERLNTEGGGKGKNRAVGIWQYTRSGLVEVDSSAGDEVEEGQGLMRVLGGKTKPKMTHHPYLEITLSARPLGLESELDTTCQYLTVPRRRNRGKAGRAAEGAATAGGAGDEPDAPGGSEADAAKTVGIVNPDGIDIEAASVKDAESKGGGDNKESGGKQTKAAPGGDGKKRKAALVASQEDRAGKRKKGAKSRSGGDAYMPSDGLLR